MEKTNKYNCNFFKLLEKQPDIAQMQAITTTKNAVIAAGAGSGKTEVLAKRFSWLVLTGQAKSDQILTLTFTNKAANEMYQRIYNTLNFYANSEINENFSETEKKLAQQGLKDFANAHVQTLDSYCSNIVRQCANRYGITPDFTLDSSDFLHDIKQDALKFIFEHQQEPGIKTFVNAGAFQTFAENVFAYSVNNFTDLTTPKNFFSSKIPVQIKFLTNALNFYFNKTPISEENFPGNCNFQFLIDAFYSELKANFNPEKHKIYAEQANELFDFYAANFNGVVFTQEQIFQFQTEDSFFQNLQKKFKIFKEKLIQLSSMNGKCLPANSKITIIKNELFPVLDSVFAYINQFESIKSLYNLLDIFSEKVNFSKRINGNLSFNDVSSLALKILIENQDIREQEIQTYKKIMIDEFQDNNGKNRDLLYLLSIKKNTKISSEQDIYSQIIQKNEFGDILKDNRESEKLFFVGDEKQSIYKFRGADVSVFNELTKNGENLLIPMTFNYRSLPQTIQAFNQIFKNGFGIFDDNSILQDFEAYYTKNAEKNGVELPNLNKQNVPIHFKFIDTKLITDSNNESKSPSQKFIPPEEQIAYHIAKKISEMKNNGANFSDFAILDKSRTNRTEITKYLNYFNIPYEVDQFNNIFEDGIVNDFYNFLRICVYPSDINAFAAYLCSPLAGLQENSVEIILSHLVDISDFNFTFDPFANYDDEIQKDLSKNEFDKFLKAKNFYSQTKTLVLQQKITKSLDLLWNTKGFKYETLLNSQTELCAEHFDMIFELARQCEENQKSVSWFIDELDILRKDFFMQEANIDTKDISYPLERNEAVKIMTIHKSKGLQFKHVFLCGCTSFSFKSERTQVFFDKKSGLSVKPETGTKNFFVLLNELFSEKEELAEFRRLIYVGITRAIEDIYVMGKWNPKSEEKNKNEIKKHSKIFENLVKNNYPDFSRETLNYKEGLPFDFEDLKPLTYQNTKSAKQNSDIQRNNMIKNAIPIYQNSKIIKYKCNPVEKLEPSKIEIFKEFKEKQDKNQNMQTFFYDNFKQDEQNEDEIFYITKLQNEEENYLLNPDFKSADFGILLHAYFEAFINGIAPQNFEPSISYFKNLNEKEILNKKQECIKFVQNFEKSQIGKSLENSKNKNLFVRSEWKTKMFYKGAIFTGIFDLIFQNEDGTYTIVDYKYYRNLNPKDFYSQLNCYRMMASKIFDIPEDKIDCKIWDIQNSIIFQIPICRL